MSDESVLEYPGELYSPFNADEIGRLATYKADVESFTSMDFFTDPTRSLAPRKPGEERTIRLADVHEEAVRAVMGPFRCLYTPTEPTSFRRTMNLLKRHLRPSPRRDQALQELREMAGWEERELARTSIKVIRNGQEFTPRANIKAHLHGVYLHRDPVRRRELEPFPPELMRGEMLGKIYALAQVYWIGRNIVAPIFDEPSLVPVGSGTGVLASRAC